MKENWIYVNALAVVSSDKLERDKALYGEDYDEEEHLEWSKTRLDLSIVGRYMATASKKAISRLWKIIAQGFMTTVATT